MASSLLVVAFDAEGVRDPVRHGETGLLAQSERRAAMRARARSAAKLRTWDNVLYDLPRTYEDIIARDQHQRAA